MADNGIKISQPMATIDVLIRGTSIVLAIDGVLTPFVSNIATGEPKTLHEYLGIPPDMNNVKIAAEGVLWGISAGYIAF